jgi:hypothetical protein
MTTARQERKSRHCGVFFVAIFGACALATGFATISLSAATTERVVVNRYTGLAIDGFDPVAYFVNAAPKAGRPDLELQLEGATWRFQNEGNRLAFAGAPGIYAPRFGGYDPMAVARGAAAPGHPDLWLIAGQRLYLFYSPEARTAFAQDPASAVEAAERNWSELQRTLVRD